MGYREIADELRARIDSGELGPGARLPSENELMAVHGVEQLTARRALDVLKNEGLIQARRGSGTFVRDFQPVRRVSPNRLKASQWGSGRSVWTGDVPDRQLTVTDVRVDREEPPAHIASVLGAGTALTRRRVYSVDGRPVQLATSYYPADLVAGSRIAEADTGPGGAYARLAELDLEPVRFREEIRSRMPNPDEAAALDLPQGTPVILVVRTAYTRDERPVEVNEMTMDAGSYVLEYRFTS